MRTLIALLAVTFVGCHPLSLYGPPKLSFDAPLVVKAAGLAAPVEVLIDQQGIPHVFGKAESDLAYGLGFMHARDRTFQVLALKYAAQGRLTELFGADLLPVDRRFRLASWNLDGQLAALTERDRRILDSYAAGVNAGAANAGRCAEMKVLGIKTFPEFTARDSLSILRFQASLLAFDLTDEITRVRLMGLLPPGDARRAMLDLPALSLGAEIVQSKGPALPAASQNVLPVRSIGFEPLTEYAQQVVAGLRLDGKGASNSWVLAGAHTASGVPILSNDPHQMHGAPSVFYLAHLEAQDFSVVGATFPGAPAVLIGHTRSLAWALTASYADTQDLLVVEHGGSPDTYKLDGQVLPFGELEQVYKIGRDDDAAVVKEKWKTTRAGPVLPPGFDLSRGGSGEDLVLAWPAMVPGGANSATVSGFFDLAKATTLAEADRAIPLLLASSQNLSLAFVDGTIAYRLASFTPMRPAGVSGRVPRPLVNSSDTTLPSLDALVQVTNPPEGFLVTANQRVIADSDPRVWAVGGHGMSPSRARRVRERLLELTQRGKATVDEVLAIQQDTVSPEARDLAPILGAACPREVPELTAAQLSAFCASVRRFNGDYTKDSLEALPYTMLLKHVREQVVRTLGVIDEAAVPGLGKSFPVTNAVERALRGEGESPLFGGNLRAFLVAPIFLTVKELRERVGEDPSTWRWAALHTLQLKGVLAVAPVVGGFFKGPVREQSGHHTAPRAEGPLGPIEHGAAFRMIVELTNPPRARMILETGQSGHPGEKHWLDMTDAWESGQPAPVPVKREEIEAVREATILLNP